MISEEEFIILTKVNFSFLEFDFGFTSQPAKTNSREYAVEYKKGELIVRVIYSLTNNYIEIIIYNYTSIVPPGKYDWRYSVTLAYLMKRAVKDFDYQKDYESLMPKTISIEESLNKLGNLFKNFAASILENKEWISWGEVAGYNQPVPSNLP